jgi:hypothetical protein
MAEILIYSALIIAFCAIALFPRTPNRKGRIAARIAGIFGVIGCSLKIYTELVHFSAYPRHVISGFADLFAEVALGMLICLIIVLDMK